MNQQPMHSNRDNHAFKRDAEREFAMPSSKQLKVPVRWKCKHCGTDNYTGKAELYYWPDRAFGASRGYVAPCSACGCRHTVPILSALPPHHPNPVITAVAFALAICLILFAGGNVLLSRIKNKSDVSNQIVLTNEGTSPLSESDSNEETAYEVISTGETETENTKSSESGQVDAIPGEVDQRLTEIEGITMGDGLEELGLDSSEVEIEFEFSDKINRGCIMEAHQSGNKVKLIVSKGRNYTYTKMTKKESGGYIDYVDEYQYDENGYCTQAIKYDGNGKTTYNFTIEYNESGMELEQTFYTTDGAFHHFWEFYYDRYGRIIQSRKFDMNDKELQHEEYEYDNSGQIVSRRDYQNGELTYVWHFKDYDESIMPMSYNTHLGGNWIYAEIFDASGNMIRYATQDFDERGAIEEMSIWVASDDRLVYQYIFDSSFIG